MKKKISAVIILAALLAGCAQAANEPVQTNTITEAATSAAETEAPVQTEETTEATEAETTAAAASVSEDELRALMEENLFCMRNVFSLGTLPIGDEPIQGENVYKVEDERFQTFADLEEYVRSVYCTETAEMYLYNYPYEDEPLYFDVDGQLCMDIYRAGSKGYYVDWTDCKIDIHSADDTICEFTVTGIAEVPADEPVFEDYPVDAKAICQDGKWVLEKMIY